MKYNKTLIALCVSVLLTACGKSGGVQVGIPQAADTVANTASLPLVLNTIKCDLAAFLKSHPAPSDSRLKVNGVSGTLVFNLTRINKKEGEFGLAVAPFGVKIGATIGGDRTRSEIYKTTLTIELKANEATTVDCTAAKMLPIHILNLNALSDQIEEAAAGSPKIRLSKVKYEGEFYLEQSKSIGGSVDIVFVKLGGLKATDTSKYLQSFDLEVDTTTTGWLKKLGARSATLETLISELAEGASQADLDAMGGFTPPPASSEPKTEPKSDPAPAPQPKNHPK